MTTCRVFLFSCLAVAGCGGDPPPEPETGVAFGEMLALSVPSVSPLLPTFEQVTPHDADDPSALLHFELELLNEGTIPVQIDRVTASYELGQLPFGVSPVVGLQDLRDHYLAECQRGGFGEQRDGFLDLPLADLASEELSDVHIRSDDLYGTVRGTVQTTNSAGQPVTVSRFAAVRLNDGQTLEWERIVDFLGFEDRANALVPADADASAYIAVGGAHTSGGAWRMAAVKLNRDGTVAMRANNTPWEVTVAIPGCAAEAVDVERLDQGSLPDRYLLGGTATCSGNKRAALALLDNDGNLLWWRTYWPGPLPTQVHGVAIDQSTNQFFAVGSYGDHMLLINTDSNGVIDPTFASGGLHWIDPASHNAVVGRELQVLPIGGLIVAVEGRQLSTGNTQLGVWKLTANGVLDAGFNPNLTGARWVSFPAPMIHAAGADIEFHENATWYTVSGTARNAAGTYMVATAFSNTGALRTTFDGDGYLVASTKKVAGAFRTILTGDFITLVGGNGNSLGGIRFHRLEGTLDDPTVLSPGERCALRWPDSGTRPDGATHVFNQWANGSIPQEVNADIRFRPVPSGASSTVTWGALLQMETIDTLRFPGRKLDDDQFWYISVAHEMGTNHRGSLQWSEPLARYLSSQRFAYDISARRSIGDGAWSGLVDDPAADGSENDDYLVYGQEVFPMADGEIVSCGSGVQENDPDTDDEIAAMCDEDGIPCYYGGGGNNVRVRHADGTFTWYAHMQNNLDPSICPHVNSGGWLAEPIPVTTATVLGRVGNSASTATPHLHVQRMAAWPAAVDPFEPGFDSFDYNDSLPLHFNDVWGNPGWMDEDDFPPIGTPMPARGQLSDTILRHFPGGDPPVSTCLEVDPLGGLLPYEESQQPDGNAPPGNGRGFYCPDDEDGDVNVCVETIDGESECRSCDTPQPGCPCAIDDQCGLDMRCWGNDVQNGTGLDRPGRCFPNSGVPDYHCAYDCRANLGVNAWCYTQPLGGVARCYDGLTNHIEAFGCWENDGLAAYAGECVTECTVSSQCQDGSHPGPEHGSGYPSEYVCNFAVGAGVCALP